jgi:hypothetical protein
MSTTAFQNPEVIGVWHVMSPREGWRIDLAPLSGDTIVEHLHQFDFTINAIAQPLEGGELIDPVGGLADAAARRLRMVAEHVFDDRPRCVLRLARLACELDLDPEPATCAAAAARSRLLTGVAPEEVLAELRRILAAGRPMRGLDLMDKLGITSTVLPEVAVEPRGREHLRALVALESDSRSLGAQAEPVWRLMDTPLTGEWTRGQALRLAALLAGDASGDTARVALGRLRAGGRLRAHVAAVAHGSGRAAALAGQPSIAPRTLHAYLRDTEPAQLDAAVLAVAHARGAAGPALLAAALEWEGAGPPPPLVGGEDLAGELGLAPGPALGNLLAELEAAQYAGEISTREEAVRHAQAAHELATA